MLHLKHTLRSAVLAAICILGSGNLGAQPPKSGSKDDARPAARGKEAAANRTVLADSYYYKPGARKGDPPAGKFSSGDLVTLKETIRVGEADWVLVRDVHDQSREGFIPLASLAPLAENSDGFSIPRDVNRVNNLGFDLLRKLHQERPNAVVSSFGLWENLRTLREAASEETRPEFDELLGSGSPRDSFATKQFHSKTFLLKRSDIKLTGPFEDYVGASRIELFNFDVPGEQKRIDEAVLKASDGTIPAYIPEGGWGESIQTVILNIVAFNGKWVHEFQSRSELTQFETGRKGQILKIPMMLREGNCKWFAGPKFDGVILPYGGQEGLAAIVLRPAEESDLRSTLRGLRSDSLLPLVVDAEDRPVNVLMPKFKIDGGEVDLFKNVDWLPSVQKKSALTGLTSTKTTFVSRITQKCWIQVDEKGTKAVATTATETLSGPNSGPLVFLVNRPFLFLVAHLPSRTLLFSAAVSRPE